MATIHRSARVAHSATQMFNLVHDVESYPRFLNWCSGAHIIRRGENFVEARVDIGFHGIHKSFTTRNTVDEPHQLRIELVRGPFRHLDGLWTFEDLAEGGSQVSLSLTFEVIRSPFAVVFSRVFEELARAQMTAFINRANTLYGGA